MENNNNANKLQQALESLDDSSEIEKYVKVGSITSESTLSEIDSLLGITATFNKKLDKVLQNGPDALKGLEMLKTEVEQELISTNSEPLLKLPNQVSYSLAHHILLKGYNMTLKGEIETKLSNFTSLLVKTDTKTNMAYTHSVYIKNLVMGIAIANFLPVLETETAALKQANNFTSIKFENNTQILGWLHKLGVLELVLEKANGNYTKAGRIVESFTAINDSTVRKAMEALYKPTESNRKNSPLTNAENSMFIESLCNKYKIQ